MHLKTTRRSVLAGLSGAAALGASRAFGQGLPLPSSPVALNIIDVAGNLQLTQAAIERFAQGEPEARSRALNFSRAPSPELPAKLKAQQDANRVDIDLVLTGPGAMSDGIQQGFWVDVWKPTHAARCRSRRTIYHEQALMMQQQLRPGSGRRGRLFAVRPALRIRAERG